jgi:NADPH-dependent ferric siderophore reductase
MVNAPLDFTCTLSCNLARVSNLLDRFLVRAAVAGVEPVTPRMRRIRIAGPALRGLSWLPGQHVRVRVETLTLRTYSVWNYTDGEHLDLGVLDHPADGPGARWARQAQVGQQVQFTRPQGRMVLRDDVPYHLFVGDETACPAFDAMLAALPATAAAYGVVAADGPDDRVPLRGVHWIHSKDAGALQTALRALDLPRAPGAAYVAGEARTCQAVRQHLTTERGWPRRAVATKPFWAPGKRGLD